MNWQVDCLQDDGQSEDTSSRNARGPHAGRRGGDPGGREGRSVKDLGRGRSCHGSPAPLRPLSILGGEVKWVRGPSCSHPTLTGW